MSRYQKGKTNLDFTEARDSEWQWHQLGHMQVCISFQTDNHASTPPPSRPDALPAAQPTASKHWRISRLQCWCDDVDRRRRVAAALTAAGSAVPWLVGAICSLLASVDYGHLLDFNVCRQSVAYVTRPTGLDGLKCIGADFSSFFLGTRQRTNSVPPIPSFPFISLPPK